MNRYRNSYEVTVDSGNGSVTTNVRDLTFEQVAEARERAIDLMLDGAIKTFSIKPLIIGRKHSC